MSKQIHKQHHHSTESAPQPAAEVLERNAVSKDVTDKILDHAEVTVFLIDDVLEDFPQT